MERDAGGALLHHRRALDAVAGHEGVAVVDAGIGEPVQVAPVDAPRPALRRGWVGAPALAARQGRANVRAADRGHAQRDELDPRLAEAGALAVDGLVGLLEVLLEAVAAGAAQTLGVQRHADFEDLFDVAPLGYAGVGDLPLVDALAQQPLARLVAQALEVLEDPVDVEGR